MIESLETVERERERESYSYQINKKITSIYKK